MVNSWFKKSLFPFLPMLLLELTVYENNVFVKYKKRKIFPKNSCQIKCSIASVLEYEVRLEHKIV